MYSLRLLSVLLYCCLVGALTDTITLTTGDAQGFVQDKTLHLLGVRYATASRWEDPTPPPSWSGTREFMLHAPVCYQNIDRNVGPGALFRYTSRTEDCLFLDIYIPTNVDGPLPITIYYHGGGGFVGSSWDYPGPKFVAGTGSILVVVNSRMGIFSYMVVPEMEEGNFGMKDNVAALQFVHANAEALGGDPDRITIMGESWGGTTTFLLTVIESAWPYYQRVISQSPLAYIYPNRTQVEEYSLQWAAAAGCNASVVPSVLDCLHNLTAEELYDNVAASQALIENRFIPYYGDPFLPIHPLVAMRDGLTKPDIEGMIVGASGNEGVSMAYWFGGGAREESQLNFPIYSMAFFPVPWYGTEEDKNAVIDFYTNGNTSLTPQEYYDALVRSAGVGFYCQIQYMMEAYPQDNDTRVYRYWFRHRSAFTVIPGNDSFHVGEIPYLFPDLVGPLRMYDGYNHTDRFVSEEMRNWWGNFARRNSPNPTPSPLPGRDWPRYRLHNKRTLNIKYTYWGFPYEILSGEHSPQECDSLLRDIYFP